VPFTHYPKLAANIIAAWVQPAPPDKDPFLNLPRFASLNRFDKPLEPGQAVVAYQDGQNFTRFYGTIASDQPLEVTFCFSNEETDPEGRWVTDDTVHRLHYDGEALRQLYSPDKQGASGKYFVMIYGRWLRIEVKNVGDAPTKELRVFVRASVF
jgi:hypothetical protein